MVGRIWAIGFAAVVVSCGRTSLEPSIVAGATSNGTKDAAGIGSDTPQDISTPIADASICPNAPPDLDAPIIAPDVQPFCGGELAVSGTTPLGAFVPNAVRVSVGSADCSGQLYFGLFSGSQSAPGFLPDGLSLAFSTPYDSSRATWTGTFQVSAAFSSTTQSLEAPATVEITAADDPFGDAGQQPAGQPQGEVHVSIDVDTGCGHITGWFISRYCSWIICV